MLLPLQVAGVVPGGEKNSWWGMVVAIGAAEAMVGPAFFGYLSDRCASRFGRRRPFIAIGAGLTAAALLFLGAADRLWMMVVGYLFLQISDDVGTGPYAALVPDLVPEEKRGRASGVLSLLQLSAQIAAAVVGLLLKSYFLIYVAIAGINIVCALIVLATVREGRALRPDGALSPKTRGLLPKLRRGGQSWLAPWRSADFRWVWLTRFLNALGFYLVLLYVVNYLADRVRVFPLFGFALTRPFEAAIVIALTISLSGAISSLFAGRWADRIGRKCVILYAGCLMCATLVPFALIPVYPIIVLLAVFFGIGYGGYLSAAWALAADILPSKEDTAKDMGIWQMSVATPQLLTGGAGMIVDWGNRYQVGLGYTVAFLLASLAFLAGSVMVKRVRGST